MSDDGTVEAAQAMLELLQRWRDEAAEVVSHRSHAVAGRSVADWFASGDLTGFMAALASDARYVVPRKPDESPLITTFLSPQRAMAVRLGAGREAIRAWIEAGAPLVHAPSPVPAPPEPPELALDFIPEFRSDDWYRQLPRWFTALTNIEDHPEFVSTARDIARRFFNNADFEVSGVAGDYTPEAFTARMQGIYDDLMKSSFNQVHMFDSGIVERTVDGRNLKWAVGRFPHAAMLQNLLRSAPFNLTDGAWLQRIQAAAPSSEAQSLLFQVWTDEAGNGVTRQNHANVYDVLLKSVGLYLPPITSPEFQTSHDILPSAFSSPVFQLCVGLFPQEFFPELLGMTLLLEWQATPTLMTAVRLLHGRGIDPLFYRLHVAIDNVSTGHGGLALRAIKSYLADKKEEGGDQAVQEHWRRIWLGYVTWDTVGFDSKGWLERYLQVSKIQVNVGTEQTKVRWPDVDEYFRGRMRALIRHKAPIASTVHGAKMLGGRLLNELFADPADLMRRLENSAYVDKRRPSQSRLLRLMDFDGPMYKVFSPDEREVIVDWIETLHAPDDYPLYEPLPDDEGTPVDPAVAMTVLIEQLAPRATTAHGGITLAEPGTATATPLADLFADAKRLMAALAHCGYVVPGQPLRSILMLVLTAETSPMRGVLSSAQVEVVRAWIEAGAELPKGAAGAKSIASLMASPGPGAQELLRRRVGTDLPGNVGLKSIH